MSLAKLNKVNYVIHQVAVLIFVVGGGVSIAEGIAHIRSPQASQDAA
jgi:NAD-dependent SIR2 family protein deacetylase